MQGTVDYVIYILWGMKDPNYVTRIMTSGGRLLANDTCKETVIRWNENREDMVGWLFILPSGVGWDIMGYEGSPIKCR